MPVAEATWITVPVLPCCTGILNAWQLYLVRLSWYSTSCCSFTWLVIWQSVERGCIPLLILLQTSLLVLHVTGCWDDRELVQLI